MPYPSLLDLFHALPKVKKNRTVMQVSGYPHYENVCSNILAFYLDPEEEHGLSDLLLQSLFKVTHKSCSASSALESLSFETINVEREYTTDGNKRIDLVITGENFVFGIENKIYHWLANDLNHYAKALRQCAIKEQRKNEAEQTPTIIKTVLGLHPVSPEKLQGGFTSITYTDLWQVVQQQLGHYLPNASQKWVIYLLDFIETTKQLTGQNMELKENDQFFIENDDQINQMIHARNDFLKRLSNQVSQLHSMISDEWDTIEPLSRAPWIAYKRCLVLDFTFQGNLKIAFDLWLNPRGWELQLWCRQSAKHNFVIRLLDTPQVKSKAPDPKPHNNRFITQTWDVGTPLEDILPHLLEWIKILPEAASHLEQT
ncbi:PD-(D/E)XK nuclease family protein [Verrucomicrobiaceae bacterium 5K15]|uniref:PD-(D/E)XK nuclease family protein n=1 Tax=Oceaniferula flava TaxID=2800421 RepID=A0AAE2VCH2_9BACT|nr:PD-(D/E)XK nuclease family protein [Oceaniferula flavus]MBK1854996.1 PD-(D/E)XK nuclease family protein [Oceaniferula flavus]MBM1136302.1 PD-(D/E)XK nuclease family protein [Oceaniferula flavus]